MGFPAYEVFAQENGSRYQQLYGYMPPEDANALWLIDGFHDQNIPTNTAYFNTNGN